MKNCSYALFARARVWIGIQLRFLSLIFFEKLTFLDLKVVKKLSDCKQGSNPHPVSS